jgi:hypothetical protein
MADDQLRLDPNHALGGARDLTASGKNLTGRRADLGNEIAALSAARPWGKDDIGAAFDKEYAPMVDKVLQAWTQIAAYVEGLGYAAAQSVQENTQTDNASGLRVSHVQKKF